MQHRETSENKMMVNEIPVISITPDDSNPNLDDNDNDDRKYDINDAHTDIEDLDSDDENGSGPSPRMRTPSRALRIRRKSSSSSKKNISEAVTDIEDYNDSDDSDSVKEENEEQKIDLNEFLDQGFVEEMSSHARAGRVGGMKQSRNTFKATLFAPVEDDGGITDCEDFDTSGDEAESKPEPVDQKPFDEILQEMLIDDGNNVSIQDATTLNACRSPAAPSSACVSDGSESENDDGGKREGAKYRYKRSTVENIMLSDDDARKFFNRIRPSKSALEAEEIVMQASDYEECAEPSPDVNITFQSCDRVKVRRRHLRSHQRAGTSAAAVSGSTLLVAVNPDEGVTDVENLNSSDDDDETGGARSHLTIPTAVIKCSDCGLTDVEDFDIDEDCIPADRGDIKLPSPVREITLMTQDTSGDPITKVMPLNSSGTFLGVVESYIDKGLTDTEDVSGNEEDYYSSKNYAANVSGMELEGGVVTNSEGLTTLQKAKRELLSHIDPLTDVEELFLGANSDGVRRRKPKPKGSRSKNLLVEQRQYRDATDMEDLYVSDDQAEHFQRVQRPSVLAIPAGDDGGVTDTEEMSGDEDEYTEKPEEIDINVLKQEAYFSTVTTCDGTLKEHFNAAVPEKLPHCELSADSEVLQLNSDVEDLLTVEGYSRAETVTPIEIRNALDETCRSQVFDHSEERRDRSNEGIHMKGYRESQEAHTDVECLEDDSQCKSKNIDF